MANALLDHALAYAALGIPVFPVATIMGDTCTCGAACESPGKHPLFKLAPQGLKNATTDQSKIRAWWRQAPNASIGGVPPAGMIVVDVDNKAGPNRAVGVDQWQKLIGQHGEIVTKTARTGSGGLHVWLRTVGWDHPSNAAGRLKALGMDVRGAGAGYVVMPPSPHKSGKIYTWIGVDAFAECPTWLRDLIVEPVKAPRIETRRATDASEDIKRAVERFNADHPLPFDHKGRQRCPACGHNGCWGPCKGSRERWSCFSAQHDGCGQASADCWTGDALDLAAFEAGIEPVELLRQRGYLAPPKSRKTLEEPPAWLSDVPTPEEWGQQSQVWDDPDVEFAPPVEAEPHAAMAYRLASTDQAYVLINGEWLRFGEKALWCWNYGRLGEMDGKARQKAATEATRATSLAFGLDMICTSTDPVVMLRGSPTLNTFRGVMPPGTSGTIDDFPTIAAHLAFMFGEDTPEWNWIVDWLAKWYQPLAAKRGHFRTQCMPILYGTTGTGKGMLLKLLKRIVGREHTIKVKGSSLDDKFSPAGLDNALLYAIDEMNDPRELDVIKTFITEDDPSRREMHKQEATFTPRFNLIATSNLIRPMAVAADDRRVTLINLKTSMPRELAERIAAHEHAGYPELPAFLHWLSHRVVDDQPMKPLANAARAEQIAMSKEAHMAFLEDVRDLGVEAVVQQYADANPNIKLIGWRTEPDADGNVHVAVNILSATYQHWLRERGMRGVSAHMALSKAAEVIPGARYITERGEAGFQTKIAGKNKRCVRALPLHGQDAASPRPTTQQPIEWQ